MKVGYKVAYNNGIWIGCHLAGVKTMFTGFFLVAVKNSGIVMGRYFPLKISPTRVVKSDTFLTTGSISCAENTFK